MRFEEQFEDVLQNIEFAVANFYRRHPHMTDYAVQRIYEAMVQVYSAEVTGRTATPFDGAGIEADLFADVKFMCEWRLGRGLSPDAKNDSPIDKPIDVPTLVLCLKRLVKSVQKWTKHNGRQGYLNFMSQYVK